MNEIRLELLVKKVWDGVASKQECAELLDFLENTESTRVSMPEADSGKQQVLLEPDRREALLRSLELKINSHENGKRISIHSVWFRRVAICAAMIATLLVSKIIIEKLNLGQVAAINSNKLASLVRFDTLSNTGQKAKAFKLADQSSVLLYPNSQLCFEHGFDNRNVILKGKAHFKIKHNANRIFTVTTGKIMTTDIGTEFEIDNCKKDKITIRLLEGKIKVGRLPQSQLVMQDQYLDKSEELKINLTSDKVVLERSPLVPDIRSGNKALAFKRMPLDIVFRKIEKRYHCTIKFKKEDIAKLTFTGNVEPTDSLRNILNFICALNNLSFSKTSDGFIIGKP